MGFLETKKAKIHYREYGTGDKIMLAFHGFGMHARQFDVLMPTLADKFRIFSFDLFFHGQTILNDASVEEVRKGLSTKEFLEYIHLFLKEKQLGEAQFSILSYSMGACMAWAILEDMPQKIDKLFFVAPDGIQVNKMVSILSNNRLVNRLAYKLVHSPKTVNFLLNSIQKFKYIDQDLHRILKQEFGSTETRLVCYNAITYNSKFRFDKTKLAALINQYDIDAFLYFGKKDKVFPAKIGQDFAQLLDRPRLHIFEEGHELVNNNLNTLIEKQLKEYGCND